MQPIPTLAGRVGPLAESAAQLAAERTGSPSGAAPPVRTPAATADSIVRTAVATGEGVATPARARATAQRRVGFASAHEYVSSEVAPTQEFVRSYTEATAADLEHHLTQQIGADGALAEHRSRQIQVGVGRLQYLNRLQNLDGEPLTAEIARLGATVALHRSIQMNSDRAHVLEAFHTPDEGRDLSEDAYELVRPFRAPGTQSRDPRPVAANATQTDGDQPRAAFEHFAAMPGTFMQTGGFGQPPPGFTQLPPQAGMPQMFVPQQAFAHPGLAAPSPGLGLQAATGHLMQFAAERLQGRLTPALGHAIGDMNLGLVGRLGEQLVSHADRIAHAVDTASATTEATEPAHAAELRRTAASVREGANLTRNVVNEFNRPLQADRERRRVMALPPEERASHLRNLAATLEQRQADARQYDELMSRFGELTHEYSTQG